MLTIYAKVKIRNNELKMKKKFILILKIQLCFCVCESVMLSKNIALTKLKICINVIVSAVSQLAIVDTCTDIQKLSFISIEFFCFSLFYYFCYFVAYVIIILFSFLLISLLLIHQFMILYSRINRKISEYFQKANSELGRSIYTRINLQVHTEISNVAKFWYFLCMNNIIMYKIYKQ